MDVCHLGQHLEVNLQLLDTVLEKPPDKAAISSTCPPNIESSLSDLSPDFMTPKQEKKNESVDLIETASLMLNPEESEEVKRMKAGSIRKEDERKENKRTEKEKSMKQNSRNMQSCWKKLKDSTTD